MYCTCDTVAVLDKQTGCMSGLAYAFWFSCLLNACIDDLRSCGFAEVAWICGVTTMSTLLRYALPPDGTSHVPLGMLMLAIRDEDEAPEKRLEAEGQQ